jgi:formate dehydrogenase subunit delta
MHIDHLVTMANRIGEFFQSMPNRGDAKQEIYHHLLKFWEPRMRRALLGELDRASTGRLLPIVREAIEEHVELLRPVQDQDTGLFHGQQSSDGC